ncbi:hypothetical protein ACFLRX_05300 [Acidobacteriota bacterium]
MKATKYLLLTGLLCAALSAGFLAEQTQKNEAEVALQRAIKTETIDGDLKSAIEQYKKIIALPDADRTTVATAILRMGQCHEKLGEAHTEDAIKAYEQVLKNYAGQTEQVATARKHLDALQAEAPSQISSTKILEGPNASQARMISPDGTKVLITRDDFKGQNVYVYDLSTKRLNNITQYSWEKEGPGVSDAIWSSDGKEIVFVRHSPSGRSGPAEIVVITMDGKTRILYHVENIKEGYPEPLVWLPDDSAILTGIRHPEKPHVLGLIPLSGGSFKELFQMKGEVGRVGISPDGRFVVFDDKNPQGIYDIYTIRTDDSSLQVLSDHPANERSPRWSPDGKHIVFLSQRRGRTDLWGIGVKDGKPAGKPFLIKEGNFNFLNWTKQGLAYNRSYLVQDLFIVSIDPNSLELKGTPRQVEYAPTGGNVSPSWSPDGKYLAFVSFDRLNGGSKIVVMPADGGEPQEFPNVTKEQVPLAIHDLRWLSDSSGLSLSDYIREEKEQTLWKLDLKTGEWIKWPIPVEGWTRTEWSKDGKSFLYFSRGSVNDKPSGITERNPVTGAEHLIYDKQQGAGPIRSLKFSWDYTKLVFTETFTGIKMIDMKTGEHRTVSSEYNGSLTLSPDAEHIIVTGERNQLGFPTAMLMLSVADGSARKLDLGFPDGTTLLNPSWSPDGKQIAFMAQSQILELFFMKNIIPK